MGYRDIEHPEDSLRGKKVIFVVGDSIVAGQGIKNYRDRFSNLLQDKLGEGWAVINIAQCGWSTEDEYQAMLSYPYKPDMLILSYYIDDMENSAKRLGLDVVSGRNLISKPSSKIIKYFVNASYAFNFFYYRFNYSRRKVGDYYSDRTEKCYLNEVVWQEHKKELLNIVDYAKNQNIELITLVHFQPKYLHELIYAKLIDFMKLNNVKVINPIAVFKGWKKKDLVVSSIDGHPSVKAHKEVANILFDYINANYNKTEKQLIKELQWIIRKSVS